MAVGNLSLKQLQTLKHIRVCNSFKKQVDLPIIINKARRRGKERDL